MSEHCKSSINIARVLLFILSVSCCACAQQPALQLASQGKPLSAAAVYTCSAITQEFKCVSAVADDTAHLSEIPTPASFNLTGHQRDKEEKSARRRILHR